MQGLKQLSLSTSSDSDTRSQSPSAGRGGAGEVTPWCRVYNTTRRLSCNRALDGALVALVLLLEDRGALTVGQVASLLTLSIGAASPLVERAVAADLVVTTRAPADRRIRIVDLSPQALQRLRREG